jgi:hypothetical protein
MRHISPIKGVIFVRISQRLALGISGAAFVGAAALTVGAAAPASAAVSAPAIGAPQSLANGLFCGGFSDCCCCGGFGGGFFDDFDDCD